MAGSSSAAARVPFGRLGDAALLKRFATAFGLSARPVIAGREVFDPLYARLPGRFPPLFEQLVTGYTWEAEVDLGSLRLLPNPPGVTLAGLEEALFRLPVQPAGCIPFALGPDGAPVCFDTERRRNDKDCPVVHDGMEISPSFKALMERLAD
ncbi:MAG TPA: hypothetical protein VH394_15745 [Thermoanaerobaculia bacterium]|jgi:hypothetical protein|nr:hypothetical protein [Thermoanaerobaculia bacterium]